MGHKESKTEEPDPQQKQTKRTINQKGPRNNNNQNL